MKDLLLGKVKLDAENFEPDFFEYEPNESIEFIVDRIQEIKCDYNSVIPSEGYIGIFGKIDQSLPIIRRRGTQLVRNQLRTNLDLMKNRSATEVDCGEFKLMLFSNEDSIDNYKNDFVLKQRREQRQKVRQPVVSPEEEQSPPQANLDQISPERRELFEKLFDGLPDEPKARMAAVVQLQQEFRDRAAKELQPSIDQLLRNPPIQFADKQTLASEINGVFHELGIAACEHGTNGACSVIANRRDSDEKHGYMHLQIKKGIRSRSRPTDKLSRIDLIPAPREEGLSRTK